METKKSPSLQNGFSENPGWAWSLIAWTELSGRVRSKETGEKEFTRENANVLQGSCGKIIFLNSSRKMWSHAYWIIRFVVVCPLFSSLFVPCGSQHNMEWCVRGAKRSDYASSVRCMPTDSHCCSCCCGSDLLFLPLLVADVGYYCQWWWWWL